MGAIRRAAAKFGDISESPRLDAEVLLAHCLEQPRSYLYTWPERALTEDQGRAFSELVSARLKPTPVAYLVGQREFYSRTFRCRAGALVPRAETELLIEQALALVGPEDPSCICDLGTGTGIIAITLKKERPRATLHATDVDPDCLSLARENAANHKAEIDWFESDWYQALPTGLLYDLIVANPPYIAAEHPFLERGDLPAEPRLALSPGDSGLEALRIIISGADEFLKPGGHLVLEHGYDQEAGVAALLEAHEFGNIRCHYDHNNLPRVTIAKRLENAAAGA